MAVECPGDRKAHLEAAAVPLEEIRLGEFTSRRFFFFPEPDGLRLALYETPAEVRPPAP